MSLFDFHMYRGVFSAPEMRAIWSEESTQAAWIRVEQTLAQVQAGLGLIPNEAAEAVARFTTADIDQKMFSDSMNLAGRPVLGLVRQMRDHAGVHAEYVHFKSTTQDVMDTAQSIQMKDGLRHIVRHTDTLIDVFRNTERLHGDTDIMARTNGQYALPMKLAVKFGVWCSELERRKKMIESAAESGLLAQVGGPVGDFSQYPADMGHKVKHGVASVLDLRAVEPHWQNARDGIVDIIQSLGSLCTTLEKIAHNINLLSSSDIHEMSEMGRDGQGASSSMGHKKNQRASEFAEAVAKLARQRAAGISLFALHQHERSGGAWIGEWVIVPEVFLLTSGALSWSNTLAGNLLIHSDAMQQTCQRFKG